MLFHLVPATDWQTALATGALVPTSLASEGFVHLSTEPQWPRTAARFFRGRRDLVLLVIDPARLAAEVRFESADGELFPHLYGALPASAVVDVLPLVPDADGLLHVARE
jgi:uncharacterized protein (DUF952 family)